MANYAWMAEIEAAYDLLTQQAEALLNYAEEAKPSIWCMESNDGYSWLQKALTDFWYEDGQDGRSTRSYVGMVGADDAMLNLVFNLNSAKSEFSYCLAKIKSDKSLNVSDVKAALVQRNRKVQDHLEGRGMARLNLKQCWRHVPTAPASLSRIHLSWYSSGRSIKRITATEAAEKLMKMDVDAEHIQIQLRAVASLPSSEVLAIVQQQAPLIRGNLFFNEPLLNGKSRMAMNLAMPLFVPSCDGTLPSHNTIEPAPPTVRQRKVRSDEKLEPEPFLPSLRIYRYRT